MNNPIAHYVTLSDTLRAEYTLRCVLHCIEIGSPFGLIRFSASICRRYRPVHIIERYRTLLIRTPDTQHEITVPYAQGSWGGIASEHCGQLRDISTSLQRFDHQQTFVVHHTGNFPPQHIGLRDCRTGNRYFHQMLSASCSRTR